MNAAINAPLSHQSQGSGPSVLLVHAGVADCRMWDPQWDVFVEGFRVTRADLRGYGASGPAAVQGADHHDLAALLDVLGVQSTALIGASFGGNVCVNFAVTYPARVSALVLVGTLAGMDEPSARLRQVWTETDAALVAGEIERAAELEARAWIDGPRRTPQEVDPGIRAFIKSMNRAILARAMTEPEPAESGEPLERLARLGDINIPALLLEGTLDLPDVAASMDRIAERVPHAERVRIEGAAHFPNLERPAQFNAAVLDFLSRTLNSDKQNDGAP